MCALVAIGALTSAWAQTPQQTGAGAAPLILTGGIEHSEKLDPVPPQLQTGAIFTPQAIPQLQPNNEWYWIPMWYAGQKHADYEVVLQDYDFRSGQSITPNRTIINRQDIAIGFQPDKNGQIWEFKRAPYQTVVDRGAFSQTMFVRIRDPLQVTANQVTIRLVQTSVMVDKQSQRILKTEQQEQINVYVPTAPGTVTVQTSIKSFGSDGLPLVQETSTRQIVDRAPFQPVDFYAGRDMRLLFREFMISHGYGNLLPAPATSPPAQTSNPAGGY